MWTQSSGCFPTPCLFPQRPQEMEEALGGGDGGGTGRRRDTQRGRVGDRDKHKAIPTGR